MNTSRHNDKLKVKLEFLGATNGIVTGSANLVTIMCGNVIHKILVDYGMFQGDVEYMNEERPILGSEIDAILLTHAHLDHCGAIPSLFKAKLGDSCFKGKIYGSRETLNQATYLLYDSAKVNESTIKWLKGTVEKTKASLNKSREKAEREDAKPKEIAAFDSAMSSIEDVEEDVYYTVEDVNEAIKHFCPIDFNFKENNFVTIELFDGIKAKFIPNTHINGSTMIELTASYEDESYTIVFTGDIGPQNTTLYRKMYIPKNYSECSIVMESLHGNERQKETLEDSISVLKKTFKKAIKKGKTIILSVFAMDRCPSAIKVTNDILDQGLNIQCFLDSPLAEKELFSYIDSYKTYKSAWFNYNQGYPLKLERFKVISSYQDHILATKYKGPNIFITTSCMGNGGRILDYFTEHINSEDSIFIFLGYLIEGCQSRILHEAKQGQSVNINGIDYIKRCETIQLQGFSAHGYISDKIDVLNAYPNANRLFLNHGDDESIEDLTLCLPQYTKADIIIPDYQDLYELL